MSVRTSADFISIEALEDAAQNFGEWQYYDQLYGDSEADYPREPDETRVDCHVSGCFATNGEALCEMLGEHLIVDCSSAGPDSGNMDHACARCGRYWHVPLY